jgi:hypothetical protein
MFDSADFDKAPPEFKQTDVASYIKSLSGELAVMAKKVNLSELGEKLDACASEAHRLVKDSKIQRLPLKPRLP